MALLGQKRRKRWNETIANIDFTHSSRKAWQTINRLTRRSHKKKNCPVHANKIASVLVQNGTWSNRSRAETRLLSAKIKLLRREVPEKSQLSVEISLPELIKAHADVLHVEEEKAALQLGAAREDEEEVRLTT